MLNNINLHRITDVKVETTPDLDRGPYYIDIIAKRQHIWDDRVEKFEFSLFSDTQETHIALLEKLKQDITSILQDYDEQLAEEK